MNPELTIDNPEQTIKACEDVKQGSLCLHDLKEEQIHESDDEMIVTYVHKMFRTKERKWIGSINTEAKADILEGASSGACPLNR